MKRKISKSVDIEHRGNDNKVVSRFRLEMRLVDHLNLNNPLYAFEKEQDND